MWVEVHKTMSTNLELPRTDYFLILQLLKMDRLTQSPPKAELLRHVPYVLCSTEVLGLGLGAVAEGPGSPCWESEGHA